MDGGGRRGGACMGRVKSKRLDGWSNGCGRRGCFNSCCGCLAAEMVMTTTTTATTMSDKVERIERAVRVREREFDEVRVEESFEGDDSVEVVEVEVVVVEEEEEERQKKKKTKKRREVKVLCSAESSAESTAYQR